MNTNAVLVGLCALSLGANVYLVASLPKTTSDQVAALEAKVDAAQKREDAVESLRKDLKETMDRIDRRESDLERRIVESRAAPTFVAEHGGATARPGADGTVDGKPLDELVAERVEKKLAERMEAIAGRDRERGDDGKWKAPIDELASELKLSDAQKAQAKKIFDHVRDEAFTLLKTQRLDGGCLLDDFAAALKSGADPAESTRQFFGRIFAEKIPGTDRSYLTEFISINQDCEGELGKTLDAGQMKRLRSLRVDLLDVKTGYDPVGDYVRAKVQ